MAMSSLIPKEKIIFMVQSGVAAWEDPEVVADWRWKTVTVCAAKLLFLLSALLELISSSPASLSFFRFHTNLLPLNMGVAQTHKLLNSLRKDSPGFSEAFTKTAEGRVCAASKLTDPSSLDLNYLSSYRNTALLQTDDINLKSSEDLCKALCGSISDFGGANIAQLLNRSAITAVLRVVEQETHSVIQIMCSPEASTHIADTLMRLGIRQIYDVRTISTEISQLA